MIVLHMHIGPCLPTRATGCQAFWAYSRKSGHGIFRLESPASTAWLWHHPVTSPCDITLWHHSVTSPVASLCGITLSHHSVPAEGSLCDITLWHHPVASPCHITLSVPAEGWPKFSVITQRLRMQESSFVFSLWYYFLNNASQSSRLYLISVHRLSGRKSNTLRRLLNRLSLCQDGNTIQTTALRAVSSSVRDNTSCK